MDYLIEYMQQRLTAQFPDYDISLEYYHSGDLAAKLQAEGADTACDIVFDCEYGYLSTYLPEQIKVGQVNTTPNYPTDIPYADMSNNTPNVKAELLAKWTH